MPRSCLQCGSEIRLGSLCTKHASEIATSEDFTAEQILSQPVADASAWLVDQWGATHPVPPGGTVGRSAQDSSLAILHHTVSSLHAQFIEGPEGWQLVDRGSLNGTFVCGLRVRQSALVTGDCVGFGDVSLFFVQGLSQEKGAQLGPGRTLPSKQQELSFSATFEGQGRKIELLERPGGGIAQTNDELTLEFARLEFALLIILAERRQQARNIELAYVSSRELADKLAFRSHDADTDNVRELIRRVRKKFKAEGIENLIESRQGVGYRLAWPLSP